MHTLRGPIRCTATPLLPLIAKGPWRLLSAMFVCACFLSTWRSYLLSSGITCVITSMINEGHIAEALAIQMLLLKVISYAMSWLSCFTPNCLLLLLMHLEITTWLQNLVLCQGLYISTSWGSEVSGKIPSYCLGMGKKLRRSASYSLANWPFMQPLEPGFLNHCKSKKTAFPA